TGKCFPLFDCINPRVIQCQFDEIWRRVDTSCVRGGKTQERLDPFINLVAKYTRNLMLADAANQSLPDCEGIKRRQRLKENLHLLRDAVPDVKLKKRSMKKCKPGDWLNVVMDQLVGHDEPADRLKVQTSFAGKK